MHEMGIAVSMVRDIERCLEDFGPSARAVRATVTVGGLRAVVPDALRFCFEAASQKTRAEGLELVIEEVPVRVRCPVCRTERTAQEVLFLCPCCDTPEQVVAGKELILRSVEIEEEGE